MKVAIVIPVFNEEQGLPELRARLNAALESVPEEWSVLLVDDGSGDGTPALLQQFHREDSRYQFVRLSRNFGLSAAISAGLSRADADAVVVMDGDLQDPPEIIPLFLEQWRQGADVVIGKRRSRKESGWRRWGIELFHRIFRVLSDFDIPRNTGTFSLFNRRALSVYLRFVERHRFLPGLRAWIGFDQRDVVYDRDIRHSGAPKQSPRKLVAYALDAIFSFSYQPLRLMTSVGVLISIGAFGLAFLFAAKRILGIETAETGFTTLVTVLLGLGGVQMIGLGVLGEYLGRIYDEVKGRPYFIIQEEAGLDARRDEDGGR